MNFLEYISLCLFINVSTMVWYHFQEVIINFIFLTKTRHEQYLSLRYPTTYLPTYLGVEQQKDNIKLQKKNYCTQCLCNNLTKQSIEDNNNNVNIKININYTNEGIRVRYVFTNICSCHKFMMLCCWWYRCPSNVSICHLYKHTISD